MAPVILFSSLLFGLGLGAGALAHYEHGGQPGVGWVQPAVLLVALALASHLIIRFQYGGQVDALDLFEAVLAPALFAFPALVVVGLAGGAKAIVGVLHRNQPVKAFFNVAQWMAAAGLGALAFGGLRRGGGLSARNLGAFVLAWAVISVVNHLAFTVVLALAEGRTVAAVLQGLAPVIRLGWLGGSTVNGVFGVLFTSAYLHSSWAVVLMLVALVVLHWGSRGFATAEADQHRLAGLQKASHALGLPVDPRDAISGFLDVVRVCFDAECVELVVVSSDGHEVHRRDARGYGATTTYHGLGAGLIHAGQAIRVDASDHGSPLAALVAEAGWRDCAAAPVHSGQRLLGALCAYNRGGLEGFEEGELAVLEALASEVGGALFKAELLATILDERRKLSQIVDNTSDGIFTLDPSGVVESWNPAIESITGYSRADMVGSSDLGALRPRDRAGLDVLFERWIDSESGLPLELQVLTATGEVRWLSCSYTKVPAGDGRLPLLVVVGRDVTRLRELERMKEEFVAIVSHELRTPLTPIKGFATSLLEMGDRMDAATRRTSAESILRSAQRLERLILNLLEVSRIETQVVDVRNAPVDVAAIARTVVGEFREAWSERRIVLEVGPGGTVALGSELWVEQILYNLLSNALKYAAPPLPVEVRVGMVAGSVELTVIDHGEGIPEQAVERIFERFERLDLSNRQAGTGLGLYIARELAHAMSGTLSVGTTPGSGATFTLRLPVAAGSVTSSPSLV